MFHFRQTSSKKNVGFCAASPDQNKAIIAKTALVLQLNDCISQAFDKLSNITDKTLNEL